MLVRSLDEITDTDLDVRGDAAADAATRLGSLESGVRALLADAQG